MKRQSCLLAISIVASPARPLLATATPLDLLLSGSLDFSGSSLPSLWRNNGNNTFSNINSGLPPAIVNGSVAWGSDSSRLRQRSFVNSPVSTLELEPQQG